MKNNELLKKYAGISPYPQNLCLSLRPNPTPELQAQFMDLVVEYMEESINWPDPDDQETFEKQLLG